MNIQIQAAEARAGTLSGIDVVREAAFPARRVRQRKDVVLMVAFLLGFAVIVFFSVVLVVMSGRVEPGSPPAGSRGIGP